MRHKPPSPRRTAPASATGWRGCRLPRVDGHCTPVRHARAVAGTALAEDPTLPLLPSHRIFARPSFTPPERGHLSGVGEGDRRTAKGDGATGYTLGQNNPTSAAPPPPREVTTHPHDRRHDRRAHTRWKKKQKGQDGWCLPPLSNRPIDRRRSAAGATPPPPFIHTTPAMARRRASWKSPPLPP